MFVFIPYICLFCKYHSCSAHNLNYALFKQTDFLLGQCVWSQSFSRQAPSAVETSMPAVNHAFLCLFPMTVLLTFPLDHHPHVCGNSCSTLR